MESGYQGEHGITVNAGALGATAKRNHESMDALKKNPVSDIVPLKRKGEPEDVAGLVNFLASKDASYITGETVRVDGGLILYGPSEHAKN